MREKRYQSKRNATKMPMAMMAPAPGVRPEVVISLRRRAAVQVLMDARPLFDALPATRWVGVAIAPVVSRYVYGRHMAHGRQQSQ